MIDRVETVRRLALTERLHDPTLPPDGRHGHLLEARGPAEPVHLADHAQELLPDGGVGLEGQAPELAREKRGAEPRGDLLEVGRHVQLRPAVDAHRGPPPAEAHRVALVDDRLVADVADAVRLLLEEAMLAGG